MAMDIDPPRRHQQTVGVDLAAAGAGFTSDCGNHAAVDRDITATRELPGAVNNFAVAYHEVMHGLFSFFPAALRRCKTATVHKRHGFSSHTVAFSSTYTPRQRFCPISRAPRHRA